MNQSQFSRREFITATTAAATAALTGCASLRHGAGIIDTHTHFYDPTRPQGVPWPPKNDPLLYRAVYPEEFKKAAQPHGVTSTIVVEASPWLEDNQWVLDLAKRDSFLLGLVGNIKPGRAEFAGELKRFSANPAFRGIRIGVWEKSPLAEDPAVVRDLNELAARGLALDVLTSQDRLPDIAKLGAAVPSLRIVVDHCANVRIDGRKPPVVWLDGLRTCSSHQNIFMKVSGLVEGTERSYGTAPSDVSFYRPTLDAIWEAFGEDRVIFGGNWPVSARFASYETVFNIVDGYFRDRGEAAAGKYFSRNAWGAYGLRRAA